MARTQGRTLVTGTEAETMGVVTCWILIGLLTLPSYITQDHQPRDGITQRELPPINH